MEKSSSKLKIALVVALGAVVVLAALFIWKESQIQAAADYLPRYQYSQSKVVEVNGRQGIATDGTSYWVSGTTSLTKYDKDWKVIAQNTTPFAGRESEVNHFGDIDVYNNDVYVSAEYFKDGVGKNIQIAIYDGDTLQFKKAFNFNADSGQEECAGITVNPDDKVVVLCSWVDGESGRYLYEYDLETGAYKGKVHLHCPPQWLQGVLYSDGAYYLTSDDGTADDNEPDHMYRVTLKPGATEATVAPELTLSDVTFQGEIEGLTVDHKTNQLMVLYNRGSRIVLGMVKGFYPGYTKEISEVYVYNRR